MSMNEGLREFWETVPIVTRYLFSSAGLLTLAANFRLFSALKLLWFPQMVYQNFEIWRPITCFLYMGGFSFPMLLNFVFLFQYAKQLETGRFDRRLADYVFMLMFGCSILLIPAALIPAPSTVDGLIMLLIYVWARTNPDVIVSFFFGLKFKAAYLPWVIIGFNILMGGMPYMSIAGALVGHLYIYLKDIYPAVTGKHYLNTPQFLVNWIQPGAGYNRQGGVQQPNIQQPNGGWGQGHRLGGR